MYAHQHFAVTATAGVAVSWLATGRLDAAMLAGALIGAEAIDVVDHPLYQAVHWKRDPAVRQALRVARTSGVREGLRTLKQLEDSRSIDGLYLHNAYALLIITALALVVGLTSDSSFLIAFGAATVAHMHCDILWDFRFVGHARNWFQRRGMPWRSGRLAGGMAAGGLAWASVLVASLAWLIERTWSVLAGEPALGAFQVLHRTAAVLITGYLTALAFFAYCLARDVRLRTGERARRAEGDIAGGRHALAMAFSTARSDVLLVAGTAAVTVVALLQGAWLLHPDLVQRGDAPGLLAIGLPLVVAVLCWSSRHTTAAGAGTLLGVLLASLSNTATGALGGEPWLPSTSFAVLMSGLAGWASGLLFSFTTGRVGGSVVLIELPLPDQRAAPGLIEVREVVQRVHRSFAGSGLVHGLREPSVSVSRPRQVVLSRAAGAGDVHLIGDGSRLRVASRYSPLVHETVAVLGRTFAANAEPGAEADGTVHPLLPRSRTGRPTGALAVQQGSVGWPAAPGRCGASPRRRSTWIDGTVLTKPISEVLDNLLTRSVALQTDVLLPAQPVLRLVVREVTSTKQYTTPESEHLALTLRDALSSSLGLHATATRLSGSASPHDVRASQSEVQTGARPELPGDLLAELRPASPVSIYARLLVATATAVGLTPVVGAVVDLAG